jgi:hypothetical protein
MVPSGYWTKAKIATTAKTWNAPHKSKSIEEEGKSEELRSTEILPADYKPVEIMDVVNKQTHLTPTNVNNSVMFYSNSKICSKGEKGNFKETQSS